MSTRTVVLGELLKRAGQAVSLEADREYSEVTVRLWGKGVVARRRVAGVTMSGARRFLARAGQLILSRIDARNGAIGLVPEELDGAVVSNDFPLFDVNRQRVLPEFLGWLVQTGKFVELCRRASEGTTNRVRLQEDRLLALEISLPSLPEQRRVVARVEEVARFVAEAKRLRYLARLEQEALVVSLHHKLSGERLRQLGDFLRLDEDSVPIDTQASYPQVGVRSFGGGLFGKASVDRGGTKYGRFNRLYNGALVLSQVKGWEGAVAVCPPALAGRFVSPEYRTFRCLEGEAVPGYLASLVATEWFWAKLGAATRGVGARRERTRPEQFLSIVIPMPSLELQVDGQRIVAELQPAIDLQSESADAVDALLPAVLDRALRGEL
ncbi:MAG TPA: restriction endonuclease subunit S [Thermoanaerobaculia bacterium]|jgi:type I restriction enzyme S subunit|nr:restriction endonuclease subunit S [Thermoanaerobaculia bacterium]